MIYSVFRKQPVLLKSTIIAAILLLFVIVAELIVPVERGLTGYYFTNIEWQGPPAFSVIDEQVSLDTISVRRFTFPHRMYSIYWEGWIQIEKPGRYIFTTRSDDGSSLYINKQQIVNNGGFHATREVSGSVDLNAGFHLIGIQYFQGKARDELEVYWQPPGQERKILPSRSLFPRLHSAQRLDAERLLPFISLWLKILTLLLSVLTLCVERKYIIQHIADLSDTLRRDIKELSSLIWERFISSKTARRWGRLTLAILFLLFAALYAEQMDYGLSGMYYNNQDWQGSPVFSCADTSFSPENLYRKAARPQEPNSLQWNGWIWIHASQDYSFDVTTEGYLFLAIDDEIVLQKENNDRIQSGDVRLYLTEGFHRLDLKYRPGAGTSHLLDFRWSFSDTSLRRIPEEILFQERPNTRGVSQRILLSWFYRQLRLFWILMLAGCFTAILLNQHAISVWLTRRSLLQQLSVVWHLIPLRPLFTRTWGHIVLIILLSLLLVCNNLGRGSIITTDFDEGMHTRVAQYMAKTGIWWSLYSAEDAPYYNKPPLKIWISALTFTLFGDSEFFIRIWDAVFGLLLFLVLYRFGTTLFSNHTIGLLGVLILMGSRDFLLTHSIRTGVMDSLMLFFFISALYCFSLREKQPFWYYLAGLCLGLGALTKSVQALVPLALMVCYLLLARRYTEFRSRPFWGMVGLALLLPALWYIPQIFVSPGFWDVAIVQQIFHRVQGKIHRPHVHGPFYFFQVIYNGFFPWSLTAVPAMVIGIWQARRRKNETMIFLLTWILLVFIGFSFSKMKVVWYMHPLYPALSLLIAAVGYALIHNTATRLHYPLLSPFIKSLSTVLILSSLYANYQAVTRPVEKLPIHLFTDYVQSLKEEQYQIVLYNLPLHEIDNADLYYLDRVEKHLHYTDDVEFLQHAASQKNPLFIILNRKEYDTHAFFQDHLFHYWLAPVYATQLYPQKVILVYNHIPDNPWFIKN